MERLILIGGQAGFGAKRTSEIIGKIFTQMGYYVFNYRDYPSLIRGGHNFNVLKISNKPVYSHDEKYDVIIAFDQNTINKHKKNLETNGYIIGDKTLKSNKILHVDTQKIIKDYHKAVYANNVLIGALMKSFGLSLKETYSFFDKTFKNSKELKEIIKFGYDNTKIKNKIFAGSKNKKYFLTGNDAISTGAIATGLDIYMAYPMTPATAVLHNLAEKQKQHNILSIQIEDEIAVANAAIGASYTGANVMIGTSGGGFALMAETMSLQGITELPLTIYLSQRTGPGEGLPTYTEQSDLKFALNAGNGEFPRIIIAPGDANECSYRTAEAIYLSNKFKILSILLGDKHISESNYTHDKISNIIKTIERRKNIPGLGKSVLTNSYEHDKFGHTIEDAKITKLMKEERMKKLKLAEKEISKLNPVSVYGKGNKTIVGWGSTKGAMVDAIKEMKGYKFLQISYISPFPIKKVESVLKKSKKIILIENNQTGQLGDIIREQTGIEIKNKLLKYDGRPFTKNEIIKGVKKWK
ncbi:MAG: 2-oxoacid:acceptor oxidoreductase family protein [Nanoarchaeota archaeon]|nr:2-oxoacid:acceptor oxidoreductase family protein [Nanoarchaeota archaeon]